MSKKYCTGGLCKVLQLLMAISLMVILSSWSPVRADGEDIFIGGPGTGNGQFSTEVRGLDTDTAGNIYVLDGGMVDSSGIITAGLFRVQKFNSAGVYQSQFSVYDSSLGVNNTPTRIAVSDSGEVFVLITNANMVRRYVNGVLTTTYTVPTAVTALSQHSGPYGPTANPGGIYVRTLAGTSYLFVMLNTGTTVRKINITNGTSTDITLSRRASLVTDLTVKSTGDLYLLGTDATTGGVNLVISYTATGAWVKNYGSGVFDRSATGFMTGDVACHTIDIDSQGNVYSIGPANEAKLLKYAFSEGKIYYRQGQFGFGDPYSIHGNDVYMAVDRNDRVYCLTTHSSVSVANHHDSPVGIRLAANYFTGAASRRLGALGLSISYAHSLPYNISNSLSPIPFDFVVAPGTRVVSTLNVSYHIYDIYKTTVAQGNFVLNLTDGVEARQSLTFTPPKYGWYTATFDMYDTTQDTAHFLTRSAVYYGVTPSYTGILPTLAAGSSAGGWNDPIRQAFSGLPFLRIDSNMSTTDIQNILTQANQYGVKVLLQFMSQSDCTQTHVQAIVNQFLGQIDYYEVVNEPDLSMAASTYVPILQNVYNWIKAIDTNAQVLGPATCGVNVGWIQNMYAAGGKNYFDILSVHDYEGNESIDPNHWVWKFGQLRSVMTTNGDGSKPIWLTERGIPGIRGGNFLGPSQATRLTLRRDVLDALGIVAGNDFYYYLNEGGFADYPSYIWSRTGPHPGALALRTRYALTQNTLPTAQLDFGTTGNKLFYGLRYTAGGTNIVMLRNLGTTSLPLTLDVSSGSTLTVVDCFGNESTQSVSGGQVTLDVPMLPIYLKLAAGQNVTVPSINYGTNIASTATFTYTSTFTGAWSTITNGVFESLQPSNPNTALWAGNLSSTPQTLEMTFPGTRTISKVVIYSVRADNPYSALLDYDLQYWNGTSWVNIQQVRTTCPTSDEMDMFDHFSQAWYLDQNFHALSFTPVDTTKLRIVVYRATYGFCPDVVANDAMQKAWGGSNPTTLHLREIEIYGVADTTPPAIPTGVTATAGNQQVVLDWTDNTEGDLAGYNVYRSTTSGGSYTKVNTALVTSSAYTDTNLTNGTPYYYVVRSVDTASNESGNSTQVSGTPSDGTAGTGLPGMYYDNTDFTSLKVTRTDTTVNFDWGSGSPDASMGANTFSVRWTGQVMPRYSETYTFYTQCNDGARLWVNGVQLVNDWTNHNNTTERSGTITLTANTKYDITMEYYENSGNAAAKLLWSSPSQTKEIIPTSRLYPPKVATPTFSPAAGTYTTEQSVTISCGTTGATIRYTTNGSDPTSTSTQYTGAIAVNSTTTLKARAFASGMADSDVATATYTFPSTSTADITVTADNSYELYVNGTLIGSGSNWTAAQTYSNLTLQIGANVIAIKGMDAGGAAAVLGDMMVNGTQVLTNSNWKVSTTLQTGWNTAGFDDTAWVSATEYGTYGVSPWGSNVSGFPAGSSAKWIWSSDNNGVDTVYLRYTFTVSGGQVATPTFSPAAGTSIGAQTVTISTTTTGASIRYTTDGSTPTSTTGTVYSAPVTLNSSCTLKAIAYKSGMTDSSVTSDSYTIIPVAGWFDAAESITTDGANHVTQWTNSAPGGSTSVVLNGTTGIAPTLVASAVNGLPALQFTGTGGLTSANAVANLGLGMPGGTDCTLVFVKHSPDNDPTGTIFDAYGMQFTHCRWYAHPFQGWDHNWFSNSNSNGGTTAVLTIILSGGSPGTIKVYLNGTCVQDGWPQGATVGRPGGNASEFCLGQNYSPAFGALEGSNGAGNMTNCYIPEVMMFSSALSDTQRQTVESYLRDKYDF